MQKLEQQQQNETIKYNNKKKQTTEEKQQPTAGHQASQPDEFLGTHGHQASTQFWAQPTQETATISETPRGWIVGGPALSSQPIMYEYFVGPKFSPAQNLGRPISFQRGPIKRALLIGANHIGPTSNCLSAVPTLSIYAQMVPTLTMFGKNRLFV